MTPEEQAAKEEHEELIAAAVYVLGDDATEDQIDDFIDQWLDWRDET